MFSIKRPLVWMAAALVLGEWIGQYGMQTGMLVSILMGLTGILLGDGIEKAAGKLSKKTGTGIWGRERYFLPFFCCLGVMLAAGASAPTEFSQSLEGYQQDTLKEESSQGITGILTGIIEDVEPDDEGIRLYVRECFLYGEELQAFASEQEAVWKGAEPVQGTGVSAGRVMITWSGADFGTEALNYIPGSRIQAEGWIYLFPKASNPGQFDTRKYYLGNNIQAGMKAENVSVTEEANTILREKLLWLEMKLFASLEQVCESRDAGVFQALLLGESRQVEEETKQLYQAGGIAHLLSISGLHISCIAMVIYQMLRRGTGSFPWGMAGGMCFLFCYGAIVGNKMSAFRAMIMFSCMMGANVAGRKYDLLSAAGLAAILILLQYPMQIYQTGFWMTFLAVVGIGVVYPAVSTFIGKSSRWLQSLLFSASVQMMVLPVILYSGYVCSVYTVLLNLLVIPLAAYLLFSAAGGAVGGLFSSSIGMFLAGAGHYILNWYDWLCTRILTLPGARMVTGQPKLRQIFLYYSVLLMAVWLMGILSRQKKKVEKRNRFREYLFREKQLCSMEQGQSPGSLLSAEEVRCLYKKKCLRLLLLAVGSLLLYGMLQKQPDGMLHITMLDVGQGECIHLQLPNGGQILIDGGSTDVSSSGTYRIEPYLLSQGVGQIHLLVVTHPDADHCNGILELLERGQVSVKELYLASMWEKDAWGELLTYAAERNIPVRYANAGDRLVFADVEISCLHPVEPVEAENDNSIVLQLKYGDFSALFTGDISMEAEDFLSELGPVTLLKVPHHGSRYSASTNLLEVCTPKIAFVSCGLGNAYGHPHEELLQRLEDIQCQWYATKRSGALFLKTDGSRVEIDTFSENVYF